MVIRIENHALVRDLCAHYRRSGFGAESVGGGMIEVTRYDAPDASDERRSVLLHLRVWEAMNPGVRVETLTI